MSPRKLLPIAIIATLFCFSQTADAQRKRPPAAKVEILAPAPTTELQGTIQVRVNITPPKGMKPPTTVYCGIGGPPWVQMRQDKNSAEWTAEINTTTVPNGAHQLVVLTDQRQARTAAQVKVRNPLKIFFADLHSHTGYSDGTLTPMLAHQYARDVAKLDVFSLTDHLESVDEAEWIDTREVAEDFNQDGKFVVIPGLEWTKKWGHLNIFDPKTRHWPNDPQAFYKAIAAADVVVKFNHPGDGKQTHDGLAYSKIGDKAIQMMEVRRPKEEQAFIRALDAGWHIAPDGSDDTHSPNWGNCGRFTGILAPGLSKRCIWDAMKKRHIYSTRDRNCKLRFKVNGAEMGTIINEPTKTVDVEVDVKDADDGDAIAKIELFEDGKVVQTTEPNKSSCHWKTTRSPKAGKHYYFAKITQADGDLIWSAPVWVEVGEK